MEQADENVSTGDPVGHTPGVAEPAPKRTVHPLIKLLAVCHMVLIMSWSLPSAAPAIANGNLPPTVPNVTSHFTDYLLAANGEFRNSKPIQYIAYSTGLWQYWDMFAPNPASTDYWIDSLVELKSGEEKTVPYARMKDLSIWEKYFKERYRKYTERIGSKNEVWKLPAFAQRMALLAYKDPADPPVRVFLRRHFRQMLGMYEPVPKDYEVTTFFEFVVDQDKLHKDSGK